MSVRSPGRSVGEMPPAALVARPEGEERADVVDHVVGAVALVQVDAPGEGGDHGRGTLLQATDDQLARVARYGDVGQVWHLREGNDRGVDEGVGEGAEAGAEDERDGGHAGVACA